MMPDSAAAADDDDDDDDERGFICNERQLSEAVDGYFSVDSLGEIIGQVSSVSGLV